MTATNSRSKPLWRWTKRILLTLGVLVFLFIFVVVPYFFSHLITHAKTRSFELKISDTPATYGVAYQDVVFAAADAETLNAGDENASNGAVSFVPAISGWYLPHDSARAVIIYAHGLFRSRQEVLERACELWQHGYAGLILDMRRHGTSTGRITSMGFLERNDILGAVTYLRDQRQLDLPIVAYGVSMGAAATLLAGAESQEIDAIIVDSSFLSFENTITHHAKLFLNLPRFPIVDLIILMTKWRVGFSGDQFNMAAAAERIGDRPILFIASANDTRMPVAVAERLFESASSTRKKFEVIPDATHGAAYRTHPARYIRVVLDFLDEAVPAQFGSQR